MKSIINALWYSSKDPKRVSLSVRAFLIFLIPVAMQALGLACQFGYQCNFESSQLTELVNIIADAVFYGLSLVGALGTVYGLLRKIVRTLMGNNLSLQNPK